MLRNVTRLYSTKKTTKSRNHYDVLKITPRATQNEIKKAYYKLTLQYHPDKNKSDFAKEKFQDISEAYEVLGNHELRKNYDRGMMIRQQPISTTRESTVNYKEQVYSGSSKIYNFDEWTRAHYGMEFQKSQKRKVAYENLKKMEKLEKEESNFPNATLIATVILSLMVLAMYFRETFDKPSKNSRHIEQSRENDKH
ncbi:dnaJ homolog subfamily C member 30-like [Pseudomyrmex gracilis]|uniref:dnaJ homolog subfamily C member 30-like n=1 Tax=Pseudomyrmex gracilis TaxID=219809 RepID=UPI000994ED34|nr:dnaJ homolog subfamily C member 30-like [Pseudomyrmex gracilis]